MATNDARLKKLESQFNKLHREIQSLRGKPSKKIAAPKRGGALSSTRRTPERGGSEIVPRGYAMRFEMVDPASNHNKFWTIRLDGTAMITHWGRIGTVGQETTKRYGSTAEAKSEGERLIASKLAKGYKLIRDNPSSPVDTWWAQ